MKKLFLTAVFMFALSQVSFAATSFADLLRQEKASSSFIPKIEVQTVSAQCTESKVDKYTLDGEEKIDEDSYCNDEDKTHDWEYDGEYSNGGGVEYNIYDLISEDIYPNDPGDECRQTRVKTYSLTDNHWEYRYQKYISIECIESTSSDSCSHTKYTCNELTKYHFFTNVEDYIRIIEETDTCYEG